MRRLALLLALIGSAARAEPPALLARVVATEHQVAFTLDITEETKKADTPDGGSLRHPLQHPGTEITRTISISCSPGCPNPVAYQEKEFDSPISAFRLWDGSDQFITIWAGGSAYHVRIYAFGPAGVRKVLDAGTKSAPQFVFLPDNRLAVLLDDPDASVAPSTTPAKGVVWTWNGKDYAAEGPVKH